MRLHDIPSRFCWTKFGTESGELIDDIVARKERERLANGGLFLWGIGNSVGPGIRALVRLERVPVAIFSPMRAKAKGIDAAPPSIVAWRSARTLDGAAWRIPSGSTVLSRAASSTGEAKKTHYALVCNSDAPIAAATMHEQIRFGELVNLVSGSPLGYSQVTSVVHRTLELPSEGPTYRVGFYASLIYPYFVELSCPSPFSAPLENPASPHSRHKPPQFGLALD
jgi:hypothetical protein